MNNVVLVLLALALSSCTKLPDSGWYQHKTTGEKLFVVMTGSEDQVKEKYRDRFTSADYLEAFSKTRSSKYISEGRPKFYAVIGDGPEQTENLRIMALEILERDYARQK